LATRKNIQPSLVFEGEAGAAAAPFYHSTQQANTATRKLGKSVNVIILDSIETMVRNLTTR